MVKASSHRKERRLTEERKRFILEKVAKEGRVLVSDLAGELSISAVTVRNDLNALAQEGLILRTHGGAVNIDSALMDRALSEKEKLHGAEKSAIAQKAVSLVHEGQSVVLDSGSTTTAIARAIKQFNNITVITNAVNIALELSEARGIEVILTGGTLRQKSYSLVGHLTEETLARLTADIFFLGVDGVDPEFGFTTPNLAEASVNQAMIRIAREVVVVTDHSKFGRRSLAVICPPERVDRIISDSGVGEKYVREFESLGVEIIKS